MTIPSRALKIGIIGAGFSGTSLALTLNQLSNRPLEITLIEKTGVFGAGFAYSTNYPFHLLNVRAKDMSAFEEQPDHFVNWLQTHPITDRYLNKAASLPEQFVPRLLYRHYLQDMLAIMEAESQEQTKLSLLKGEVLDVLPKENQATIRLRGEEEITVDKVVLAMGNHSPSQWPFPMSSTINHLANPWDYEGPNDIPSGDQVLIVGTGLSMIDAVLTLYYQQHRGKIYALSRHGLLPLPHTDNQTPYPLIPEQLPRELRALTNYLRTLSIKHRNEGGDWRSIIHALRTHAHHFWQKASINDKKRFLRHLLPYWNIHRHRVNPQISSILSALMAKQQLEILSGRIMKVENGFADIKLRGNPRHHDDHAQAYHRLPIKWVMNCMGPSSDMTRSPLIKALLERGLIALDALNLGLAVTQQCELLGNTSAMLYTLGPLTKGTFWECGAVPEIRKQTLALAKHILAN